jgi:hypothetical protein
MPPLHFSLKDGNVPYRFEREFEALMSLRNTKLDFCPFWEIEDCQKSLACLMAATALYAAGARADRMVSCKDCERFENCWEAAAV